MKKIKVNVGYVEARKAAYPTLEEQMDILYNEGYDAWRSKIKAIKDKYPKGKGH